MSKRRERKPNLPQDTLERARRQIAGDLIASEKADEDVIEPKTPAPALEIATAPIASPPSAPRSTESAKSRANRRRNAGLSSTAGSARKEKIKTSDPAYVAEMLANPTKIVTQEDLRQEYGYVLADLRSMIILAAALFIGLIIVAQILPVLGQ